MQIKCGSFCLESVALFNDGGNDNFIAMFCSNGAKLTMSCAIFRGVIFDNLVTRTVTRASYVYRHTLPTFSLKFRLIFDLELLQILIWFKLTSTGTTLQTMINMTLVFATLIFVQKCFDIAFSV